MRRTVVLVALVALLSLGVFWFFLQRENSANDPTDASRCVKSPSNTINTVATGLGVDVSYKPDTAVLVEIRASERDSAGWPQALYAVQITNPEGVQSIAVWGVGNPRGLVLPITALNQPALENSSWGTRAGDMNADTNRRFASSLKEQALIQNCVAEKAGA